jgi:aspartokinase
MKVLKFGGTSVANADIKLVLRIINEAKEMKINCCSFCVE